MLKIVRWCLGRLILFVDWVTRPSAPKRSVEDQQAVNARAIGLALYEFRACPFCVKVRRELKRLGVDLERRDAARNPEHKRDLVEQGGRYKVPCLRINEGGGRERWLYESDDVIAYLRERFATPTETV
ncbi:MAG: glutathione S-transferase N-terminal domain-containing protein [Pseudomonadota bacterium]